MADELNFVLETLKPPPTLDATLSDGKAGRPRIMSSRDIMASRKATFPRTVNLNSDLDGDGELDRFTLNANSWQSPQLLFNCNKRTSVCSLFVPPDFGAVKN